MRRHDRITTWETVGGPAPLYVKRSGTSAEQAADYSSRS
jgi:hypothetical protein